MAATSVTGRRGAGSGGKESGSEKLPGVLRGGRRGIARARRVWSTEHEESGNGL